MLFVTPVAWPPPSPLVCLQSLQVKQSPPASATSPARSPPDGQAATDKGAKERPDILATEQFTHSDGRA